MEHYPKPFQYSYRLLTSLFFASLLLVTCRPDAEELQQEAIIQVYDEVQAQLADVTKEIQLLHDEYDGHKKPPVTEGDRKLAKQRDISALPISKEEIFSSNLLKFIEVLSDSDYPKFVELLERRVTLQKKLRELPDANGVYVTAEVEPTPENGMMNFYQYIGNNLEYGEEARQKGIEGDVLVEFVVNEYGELTNFRVVKEIGAGCDEEAIKVLASAPRWNPGITNGKPVPVRRIASVRFGLHNDQIKR